MKISFKMKTSVLIFPLECNISLKDVDCSIYNDIEICADDGSVYQNLCYFNKRLCADGLEVAAQIGGCWQS